MTLNELRKENIASLDISLDWGEGVEGSFGFTVNPMTLKLEDYAAHVEMAQQMEDCIAFDADWLVEAFENCNMDVKSTLEDADFRFIRANNICSHYKANLITVYCTHSGMPVRIYAMAYVKTEKECNHE